MHTYSEQQDIASENGSLRTMEGFDRVPYTYLLSSPSPSPVPQPKMSIEDLVCQVGAWAKCGESEDPNIQDSIQILFKAREFQVVEQRTPCTEFTGNESMSAKNERVVTCCHLRCWLQDQVQQHLLLTGAVEKVDMTAVNEAWNLGFLLVRTAKGSTHQLSVRSLNDLDTASYHFVCDQSIQVSSSSNEHGNQTALSSSSLGVNVHHSVEQRNSTRRLSGPLVTLQEEFWNPDECLAGVSYMFLNDVP